MERTFAIIKPDVMAANKSDALIDVIKQNGFRIVVSEQLQMSTELAQKFYAVHKDRPFFGELVEFITSGPVIVMALEKDNAIKAWRKLMGATNPAEWAPGTIRKEFGTNIGHNAAHGSDAPETAVQELKLFFPDL